MKGCLSLSRLYVGSGQACVVGDRGAVQLSFDLLECILLLAGG